MRTRDELEALRAQLKTALGAEAIAGSPEALTEAKAVTAAAAAALREATAEYLTALAPSPLLPPSRNR